MSSILLTIRAAYVARLAEIQRDIDLFNADAPVDLQIRGIDTNPDDGSDEALPPNPAKDGIVSIRADGSIENIEVSNPSKYQILNAAAMRIVKLAGQNGFPPLPPDITRDVDILTITRTWSFTPSDKLESE